MFFQSLYGILGSVGHQFKDSPQQADHRVPNNGSGRLHTCQAKLRFITWHGQGNYSGPFCAHGRPMGAGWLPPTLASP